MESKKEHIKNLRLSEKFFVLFIQYPPDEGLFLLDWRQFFSDPKTGRRGSLDIPWGPNCQTMLNETLLAVKFNTGSIAKPNK